MYLCKECNKIYNSIELKTEGAKLILIHKGINRSSSILKKVTAEGEIVDVSCPVCTEHHENGLGLLIEKVDDPIQEALLYCLMEDREEVSLSSLPKFVQDILLDIFTKYHRIWN